MISEILSEVVKIAARALIRTAVITGGSFLINASFWVFLFFSLKQSMGNDIEWLELILNWRLIVSGFFMFFAFPAAYFFLIQRYNFMKILYDLLMGPKRAFLELAVNNVLNILIDEDKFSGKVKTKELLARLTDKLPDFMKNLNKTSIYVRPIMKLFFKKFNFLLDVQEVLEQEQVLEWTREDLVKRLTDRINERFSFSILAPRPIYAFIAGLINILFLTGSYFAVTSL